MVSDYPDHGMKLATMVFVADVADARLDGNAMVVSFNVLESFKGPRTTNRTLHMNLEVHAFGFRAGQRVLVYAFPAPEQPDALSTSCSGSREVQLTDKELVRLRQLARRQRAGLAV
jgi:hypothetical protein